MLHQIPTHKPSKAARHRDTQLAIPKPRSLCCQSTSVIALKEARCELVARTSLQLCRSHTCAGLCAWRAKFKLASLEPGRRGPSFPCYAYRVRGEGGKGGGQAPHQQRRQQPCWHAGETTCGAGSLFLRSVLICHLVLSLCGGYRCQCLSSAGGRAAGGPSSGVRSAEGELGAVLLRFLALVVVEVEPALLNDGGHPLLVLSPVLLVQLCCQAVGRAVGVGLIQQ